jgi:hypothetical protein
MRFEAYEQAMHNLMLLVESEAARLRRDELVAPAYSLFNAMLDVEAALAQLMKSKDEWIARETREERTGGG